MRGESTLRKRMMYGFILAALIPVCLFACISQARLRSTMEDNINRNISSNLHNAAKCLDMTLDKYSSILYDFCTDNSTVNTVESILKNDNAEVNTSALRDKLGRICNRNIGIEGITVFLDNGKILSYDRLNFSTADNGWAEKVKVPEIKEGEVYQGVTEPIIVNGRRNYLFQIGRRLTNYNDIHQQLGTVVLSIDENQIKNALESGKNNTTYLLDNNVVISSKDTAEIGKKFSGLEKTKGNKYTKTVDEKSGFIICNVQFMDDYNKAIWEQVMFLLVLAAASGMTMLLLIFCFTKPYLTSVDLLADAMNEVEKGNFSVRLNVPSGMPIEIKRIGVGFNEMTLHISSLIQQVKEAVVEQKNAELSALEAQIDPHFLYNTLDTINWKAIENEQYDISEMVGALADILRYTVKNAGGTTTVRQELGWLREYTMLLGAKTGKRLHVGTQVPEEVMGYQIHKLLLQPFVENSIKHGFNNKAGEFRLNISIRVAGKQLHIIIEDNGCGITYEQLKKLNDDSEEMEGHVGVTNVRKRLKLYYGQEAVIYFESLYGKYTKVHLFIPCHMGKEEA